MKGDPLYRPDFGPVLLRAFKTRRSELGQTFVDACKQSGISQSTYYNFTRGLVTQTMAMRVVKYCGCVGIRDFYDRYRSP